MCVMKGHQSVAGHQISEGNYGNTVILSQNQSNMCSLQVIRGKKHLLKGESDTVTMEVVSAWENIAAKWMCDVWKTSDIWNLQLQLIGVYSCLHYCSAKHTQQQVEAVYKTIRHQVKKTVQFRSWIVLILSFFFTCVLSSEKSLRTPRKLCKVRVLLSHHHLCVLLKSWKNMS